jgi:hypothetical protein
MSSTKQKLNTQSSTESEIVGADDFMLAICLTRYFMEAQGYQVQDNVLTQDNKSTILLEKNGKASSSNCMKHLNIRYFFITDHVDKGNISLVWCPTRDMIGYFMTKPLKSALFQTFRDQIMGVVPAQDPGPGKTKTKIDELNTHTDKPMKGKELKPSRGKSSIYISPPQTVEIDDLDIPQPDPPLIETIMEPTVPQMEQDEPTQVAQPMETTGLRRSARVKFQPKQYELTMTVSKYSYAVTQLETHGVLHPDSHMFVQEYFYQTDPDVVAHIMTQLSALKSGLKRWGNKAYAGCSNVGASQSIGANYQRLSARRCWNHTCFSRRNKMDPSKEGLWLEETNSETTFPLKMQVCQPLPQKPCCYQASLMPRKKGMSQF